MHPSLTVRLLKLDESRKVKPAPLQHLSLTRGVQQVPSNEDRLEALGMWALGCGAFVGVARMAGVA